VKNVVVSAPVLTIPDFSKDFVVTTDACGDGSDAILLQQGQPLAFFRKHWHQGINPLPSMRKN